MGFLRVAALLIFGLVAIQHVWLGQPFALVDSINLVFHEGGHVIFAPLGQTIAIAGGSLFQAGLPAVLAYLAFRDREWSALGGCLVWLATAFEGIGRYAADARARELPLLGGEASIHDWWYLLRAAGWLDRDQQVAGWFWTAAQGAAVLGIGCLLLGLFRPRLPD